MKKYILLAAFVAAGVISVSQTQDVMTVKMKDGTSHEFKVEDVSEVTFGSSEINPSYPVAEAIDLGLPSGTLWASWNVGASKPEEYGGYYAWGETEEKDYYDWSTYKHCDGSEENYHDIGEDIAGTEYDVAHMKWGGQWCMPTSDQINELIKNCKRLWTSMNGVNGILVAGPNGNTIFLPAAGSRGGGELFSEGSRGFYWSSSLGTTNWDREHCFYFYSDSWYWLTSVNLSHGFTVRPVCP